MQHRETAFRDGGYDPRIWHSACLLDLILSWHLHEHSTPFTYNGDLEVRRHETFSAT